MSPSCQGTAGAQRTGGEVLGIDSRRALGCWVLGCRSCIVMGLKVWGIRAFKGFKKCLEFFLREALMLQTISVPVS